MTRLLYLVSHPIQYQAPLLRRIARRPGIDLTVRFLAIPPEQGGWDPGFCRTVAWDLPLRDGYANALLEPVRLSDDIAAADAVWLHGWQGRPMRRALNLARRLGRPVLMRAENCEAAMPDGPFPRGWLKRRYLAWVFARCAAFLAIGSANRDYYLTRGVAPERIFAMPYAVDNEFFAAAAAAARPRRPGLRAELGLPPERPIVLYAGKLMARKNPDVLLEAWRHAWPAAGERPLLVYVGDGEMRAGLEERAGEGVHFLGFRNQTELPALYDLADVFVLPSVREPWGLAINEAMACGTAVIAGNEVGAVHDLVDESVGATVPARDVEALALALRRVMAEAGARGARAAERVRTCSFDADVAGLEAALAFVAGDQA